MKFDLTKIEIYRKLLPFIQKTAADTRAEVFIVGGSVRDIYMAAEPSDVDFVVFRHDYCDFAGALAKSVRRPAVPFKDNIRIPFADGYIDISAPRGLTIEEDLCKRDFTVNNLALDLNGCLIGNPEDIERRLIRPVHENIFDDDPLRIMRGYRQAASLGFNLTADFSRLAAAKAHLLPSVAMERIYYELRLLILAGNAPEIYSEMLSAGIWKEVLGFEPDIETLSAAASHGAGHNEDERVALFLASVLAEREDTEVVLNHINASGAVSQLVLWLKSSAKELADKTAYDKTLWRAHTKGRIKLLFSYLSVVGQLDPLAAAVARQIEKNAPLADVINGTDILKIAPEKQQGPWMADTLERTRLALVYGRISGREEALRYLKDCIDNI